jgi:hypothetical protein
MGAPRILVARRSISYFVCGRRTVIHFRLAIISLQGMEGQAVVEWAGRTCDGYRPSRLGADNHHSLDQVAIKVACTISQSFFSSYIHLSFTLSCSLRRRCASLPGAHGHFPRLTTHTHDFHRPVIASQPSLSPLFSTRFLVVALAAAVTPVHAQRPA